MATDVDRLIVSVEARMRAFEREMQRMNGVADKRAKAVEVRFQKMNKTLDTIGRSAAASLIGPLSGIGAALSVREVMQYADAWTAAKNSLAVAGVTGSKQVDVLNQIYRSAQNNAAPVTAMADLFGKASQASDNLGASQQDLLKFSDGVGVALRVAGTGASEASGSLTQLGQLLGQARVQAEEFNSINEGARPILIAVANGLDKAGGSVNKLKQLVNDGKVSGKQFFEAFLKGLPSIQSMAANATQTIDQGLTKVNNAFTKYIGEADASLGVSERLVAALNALADNFDGVGDTAVAFATIIAGALAGRAIGGMILALGNGVTALMALNRAIALGTTSAITFRAALGPLSVIAGIAAGAAIAFSNWSTNIDDATRSLAESAAGAGQIQGMIDDAKRAQDAYKSAIASTAGAQTSASTSIVADTKREFEAKKSLLELEVKRQQALIAVKQAELSAAGARLKSEIGSKVMTRVDTDRTGFSDPRVGRLVNLPDDITGLDKTREVIAKSPISAEIQKIRAEMDLTEVSANKLSSALNTTFSDTGGGGGASAPDAGGKGKGGKSKRADEFQRMSERIKEATEQLLVQNAAQQQVNPTVNDYGRAVEYATARQELLTAAQKAGMDITPALQSQIDALAGAYADASVASEKLAATQAKVKEQADFFKQTAYDAFSELIPQIETGNAALDKFLNTLIEAVAQAALLGTGPFASVGGGGLFGGLFKLFGFAKGGIAANGKPQSLPKFAKGGVARSASIFGEAGPEAAVPLPDGRRIPVDLRGPRSSVGGSETITINLAADQSIIADIADQRVQTASGTIVQVAVSQSTQRVVPTMASYQKNKAGAEWRS